MGIKEDQIIEVYPKATLFSLARASKFRGKQFGTAIKRYKRDQDGKAQRKYLTVALSQLVDFGDWLEECWEDHNKLDAVIAALTGQLHGKKRTMPAVEKGFEADGVIHIPDWFKL